MSTPAAEHGHQLPVEVRGLRHAFVTPGGDVQALDLIDLTIEPGQFVCLVGPSGCGKTTLIRLMAGFMPPTEGTISVGGEQVRKPSEDRGMVFQAPMLYPWLTVRKNVELGPKLRGIGKAERQEQAQHYLTMVGLSDFTERRPYELSGGMQQRCQIARVLTNDPDIVLMDEPFGALDAMTRERLQNELLEIWRATGKTIVFITHGVDEAVFLGSRVMVMSARPGRIVFDESATLSDPSDPIDPGRIRALPAYSDLVERVRGEINAHVA